MDSELILRQFEQIEQRVENLMDVCKTLETANSELTTKVDLLEDELQKKTEAENGYQEEKVLVRSKIDGLLAKLNNMDET